LKFIAPFSLSKEISAVMYDSKIFDMSLLENLRMVSENASYEKIYKVCRVARIEDLVFDHDKKPRFDDKSHEKLSGGQKQRIALARALLFGSRCFIFDEATSALDVHTELHVNESIVKMFPSSTIISVTHRLSSLQLSDKVVVLNNGKIEWCGCKKSFEHDVDFRKIFEE